MTILLVLSFINAFLQIFSSLVMYVATPAMSEMLANGQMEEVMAPYLGMMDEDMSAAFMSQMELRATVNPTYYLFTFVLYIVSLVGVKKMFKIQRLGFHLYSISQLLILIFGVMFIFSKQTPNPFFSEFLTTLLFILIYHLYFKRIEYQEHQDDPYDPKESPSDRE